MTRIIRVVDLETTGLAPPDAAPCEVGAVDIREHCDLAPWKIDSVSYSLLCNPSRPIPPEISAIHHIVDEDVSDAPFWPSVIEQVSARDDGMLSPQVFAAHNAKFERQWFTDEVTGGKPWICTYKCAVRLWPDAPSHGNQALRYWLKPNGLDREIAAVAHRAFPDAYVTAFLLLEMLKKESVETLIEWTSKPILLSTIRFGKHAGKKFAELPTDYLQWMTRQDFDEDVAFTVKAELKRRG